MDVHKRRRIGKQAIVKPVCKCSKRTPKNSSRIIGEPMRVHKLNSGKAQTARVEELLELVQLNTLYLNRYPHEFSGGQRQRIGVARALASEPEFIVCDEPISALDVSIQAQVVNLLEELQDQFGLTYLFIAHDLSMIRHICDRVAVMYLGVIVELAARSELFDNPLHPYTQALLDSIPRLGEKKRRLSVIPGEVPNPLAFPSGCRFRHRCPSAEVSCKTKSPVWLELTPTHRAFCSSIR